MTLAGFNNFLRLTIDSSKIDEDLTNFPVSITLSSGTGQTGFDATAVFDELATITGTKNIAITDSNDNKLYVEIERWDWDNKEANLWVNVPTIASDTDTDLYLYYDATASGQDVRPIADAEDDFTGTNGSAPNPLIWLENDSDGFLSIQSNKLNYTASAGVFTSSKVESTFYLGGDFDIQIDFDSTTTEPTENLVVAPSFFITGGGHWSRIIHGNQLTTGLAYAVFGSVTGWVPYNTADTSGKLRFTRSGTTIKGYIWSGSQWEWDGNTAGYTFAESHSNDVFVSIAFTRRPNGSNDCDVDNFTINSADYVTGWIGDTGETPAKQVWDSNFKSVWHMAQEPSNNDVLLRATEVGNVGNPATAAWVFGPFDCTGLTKVNGTLVIDLKCDDPSNLSLTPTPSTIEITSAGTSDSEEWSHTLTSSELSKLSTTYERFIFPLTDWVTNGGELDVSQVDYIRWWGYAVSGNVTLWWKNAYLIWPDGEEHMVLDSTSNENHGVFQESMTDGDLVDGKIGKGIEFDGTDDEIDIGTHASLDLTSAFTYEAIFNTSSTAQSQDIITKFNETGTDYQMELHINADGSVASNIFNDVLASVNCNTNNGLGGNYIDSNHHYVATNIDVVSGDGKSRLFMNGVLNVTSSTSHADINSLSTISTIIGERYNSGSNRHMIGVLDEIRISNVKRSDTWIKATYYSNWDDLVTFTPLGVITFIFSGPIPTPLSTVYGVTHQLQLITTVSGSDPNYIYDATFYDASDDGQIGSTISETPSGQYVSTTMTTVSATNYSWYVTATSSEQSDTSSTYSFSNRFMCSGQTQVAGTGVSGISVRLYRRSTGAYIGGVISSGVSGTFNIPTDYNENHYAVALYPTSGTNALIADFLIPSN